MRAMYLFCFLASLTIGGTMSLLSQQPSTARTQIEHLLNEQAAAWNHGDSAAWAAPFSEDADFINIRGQAFSGRAAIAQQHARIFGGPFKGSQATVTIRRFTEPSPDVALVETDHEVSGFAFLPPGIAPTAPGILRTHMKYVALQKDGSWHFIAAQNTAIQPPDPPK